MKKILLIFVGLMMCLCMQSQSDWIEKNSNLAATKGVGQISAGMLDPTALWGMAINADGSIYDGFTKSIDAGQNWFPGTFNAGDGLSMLFAIDATTCWAVFNTGATQGLYKTVNGGTTWTKKGTAYGSTSFANVIHFFNENDGVAQGDPIGGYFEIYTTSNGGETWTRVASANIPTPVSGEYGITGNYDAVGDHIWFGTNKGRIFHSADKGQHWTAALTNFGSAEVVQPEFASETNGICFRSFLDLGIETVLGITSDGGATWTTVNVSGTMFARYYSYVPGTEATYVSSSGGVVGANGVSYSTDGGYTWSAITEGYDFLGTVWLDNETGWAGSFAQADRTTGGIYIYDGPPLEPFAVPAISLNPEQITAQAEVGAADVQDLVVTNTGGATLDYSVHVIYPAPAKKSAPVCLEGKTTNVSSLGYQETSANPNGRPAAYNPPPTDDFILHYDGNNENAIGWSTVPVSPTVAAMFPTNLTLPHAGMLLSSVDLYINDPGTNYILKIWDMGTSNAAGALLVSQAFAGQSLSWNSIELADPVYITGADIWVGYQFTQTVEATYIPGVDAGPHNVNGDWIYFGASWSHLSDNPDLDANWNIRANLTGTPITQWLSVSPAGGTIEPAGSNTLIVACDATGLEPGTYEAALRFISNDPTNSTIDLPVTFEVLPGGSAQSVVLDFESQADWAVTFDPWTAVDNDGADTYGFETVTFPGAYGPLSFIAFNPATTEPPMTDDLEIQPHGGVRFGACMASVPPPFNDDWMISPQIDLGMNSSITLWVKSYTDEYGLEKYNVLVSTTDMNPASFTSISGSTPMQAPMAWTEVNFDLSAYDNQTVYVAIQCVSEDAFIFMLDDVSINFTGEPIGLTSNFSADPLVGSSPLDVQFIDESSGYPTIWKWDFQNDGVYDAFSQNPSYTYSQPGIYSVKLVVQKGSEVDSLIKYNYITVNSMGLNADFSATPLEGMADLYVQFTDESDGDPTIWKWDFQNDGVYDAFIQQPSFTYLQPGDYSVKLFIQNAEATDSLIKVNYINIFESSLDSGLVAHYPFNGNANDESGNENNGTTYGSTLTSDRFGNPNSAYNFNGNGQYIEVLPSSSLNTYIMNSFSMSIWGRLNNLDDFNTFINVSRQDIEINYDIRLQQNGKVAFNNFGGGVFLNDPETAQIDSWYHVVIVLNYYNNSAYLYVNGQLVDSEIGNIVKPNNPYYTIGKATRWPWFFNGDLDDIYIYNRILSSEEIINLYEESSISMPEICIVSVSPDEYNKVIWEKQSSNQIDSYNIYRETTQANVYEIIGSVSYEDSSIFVDMTSNPEQRPYKYKISAISNIETETALSNYHRTIHLTINQGPTGWNLIWSPYEGFPFSTYYIYRGTFPNSLTLLDSISSSFTSYSDINPPWGPLYYAIEIINEEGCNPTRDANYNRSRSNVEYNGIVGTYDNIEDDIRIYPNPANDILNIQIDGYKRDVESEIIICDIHGMTEISEQFKSGKTTIRIQNLNPGLHIVKIKYEQSLLTKKLIVIK